MKELRPAFENCLVDGKLQIRISVLVTKSLRVEFSMRDYERTFEERIIQILTKSRRFTLVQ